MKDERKANVLNAFSSAMSDYMSPIETMAGTIVNEGFLTRNH